MSKERFWQQANHIFHGGRDPVKIRPKRMARQSHRQKPAWQHGSKKPTARQHGSTKPTARQLDWQMIDDAIHILELVVMLIQ